MDWIGVWISREGGHTGSYSPSANGSTVEWVGFASAPGRAFALCGRICGSGFGGDELAFIGKEGGWREKEEREDSVPAL